MPVLGKEVEYPVTNMFSAEPTERVLREEKVERRGEIIQPLVVERQSVVAEIQAPKEDMGEIVSKQYASQTRPSIVLPMTQNEMEEGLHQKVWKSVRWASEWCLMMIKKYPGRVFYLPPETR